MQLSTRQKGLRNSREKKNLFSGENLFLIPNIVRHRQSENISEQTLQLGQLRGQNIDVARNYNLCKIRNLNNIRGPYTS